MRDHITHVYSDLSTHVYSVHSTRVYSDHITCVYSDLIPHLYSDHITCAYSDLLTHIPVFYDLITHVYSDLITRVYFRSCIYPYILCPQKMEWPNAVHCDKFVVPACCVGIQSDIPFLRSSGHNIRPCTHEIRWYGEQLIFGENPALS